MIEPTDRHDPRVVCSSASNLDDANPDRDVLVKVLGWIEHGSLECRRKSGPVSLSSLSKGPCGCLFL